MWTLLSACGANPNDHLLELEDDWLRLAGLTSDQPRAMRLQAGGIVAVEQLI